VRRKEDPKHAERMEIAKSDRSDLEKMELLGVASSCADPNEPDIFDGLFRDHSIDIQTGALIGRYIAEERDTGRLAMACRAKLEAKVSVTN
jgi:hypothetical protein